MRKIWILIFSAVVLFLLDASTKYWVQEHLSNIRYSTPFFPYGGVGVFQDFLGIDFCITHARNLGGAWSLFSSYPLALLSVRIAIILTLVIYIFFFNKERKRDVPLMLILVGALANIVDFFLYGSVVDMFHFVLWGYSFPVFNIADMLIFFGVATLMVQSLIEKFKPRESRATQPSQS